MTNLGLSYVEYGNKIPQYNTDYAIANGIKIPSLPVEPSPLSPLSLLSVYEVNKTNIYQLENRHVLLYMSCKQR
jgi:hypothetical protein